MKNRPASLLLAASLSLLAAPALAQFSPGPNPINGTVATAQTLASGTGTITSGGSINISSGSSVPLTITGTSTLNNDGTIQTLGTGRAIDSNSANSNLTVTNTGLISSVSTDAFRVNSSNSSVSLTNSGTIRVTAGGQAIDWAAITSGGNTLNNQATGVITAVGDDAVRPGQNGIITNAGNIAATPTGSATPTGADGIDLRTEKTVTITNTGTISGRHGIATDGDNAGPSSLTVNNNAGTISALNGSGINVDAQFTVPLTPPTGVTANVTNAIGATIKGGVLSAATAGDGDGIDVDGVLTLNNSGDVLGLGAKGLNNPEGIATGGGSITNTASGRIIGSSLLADAPNGDASKLGSGILVDNSSGGNAVAATTVTNSGLIQGKTGFGVKIIGTFNDTINNNAGGTIRAANNGTVNTVIQTGGGNDTINNAGAITHDNGNTQTAVSLEGGNDTLTVTGGSATITGSIDGGSETDSLNFTLGAGNSFAYTGTISKFEIGNVVSGDVNMNGTFAFTLGGIVAGTADTQYDQLDLVVAAGSSFTLGGASQLSLDVNFSPAANTEFVLLDVADGSSVGGKFAGLNEGDQFTQDGQAFRISYVGGTGNDITVTAVPEASSVVYLLAAAGGFLYFRRCKRARI